MSITTFADLTSLIRPDAPADKVLDFVHLLKQSEANIALPNVAKEITVSEEKPVYKSIQVKSRRGAILRTLPIITKGDEKIAKAMQVVASEGWHLYEMQFAIYCRYHGLPFRLLPRNTRPNSTRNSLSFVMLSWNTPVRRKALSFIA